MKRAKLKLSAPAVTEAASRRRAQGEELHCISADEPIYSNYWEIF